MDKSYIYDERPGFESYSSINFPYPGGMPFQMPMYNMNNTSNNCTQKVNNLENKLNNLEDRIQKLESSLYPSAIDYSKIPNFNYQNSMNVM